jgi:hypothetical protein
MPRDYIFSDREVSGRDLRLQIASHPDNMPA